MEMEKITMNRFFYTFGSDWRFPYQNGWVEVHADTLAQAHEKFRSRFPDRHKGTLNCAFFYNAEEWQQMNPEENWHDYKCYEIIE